MFLTAGSISALSNVLIKKGSYIKKSVPPSPGGVLEVYIANLKNTQAWNFRPIKIPAWHQNFQSKKMHDSVYLNTALCNQAELSNAWFYINKLMKLVCPLMSLHHPFCSTLDSLLNINSFSGTHVAEEKLEWIFFWSTDRNENPNRKVRSEIRPKKIRVFF